MNDAWPAHAADARQALPAMSDQRVYQRAGRVSRCGMNHQPGRFVQHDQVFVLVNDRQRYRLAHRLGHRRLGDKYGENLTRFDPV